MSYILDALKKMEHEKVKKARGGGMSTISGELFREERPRPPKGGAWRIIAVAVVTACVAMTATWFFLKPAKTPKISAQRKVSPAVPSPPPPPAQPAVQVPVAQPVQQQVVQPSTPAATPQKTPQPQPASVAAPAPAASTPAAQPAPGKTEISRKERKKQPAPTPIEQRPAVATIAPPADIKVSGIAWQEERSARRAVVNGFLMKEGSVVAGARISEILRDRVRFSTPGGEFELSMVASGIPGASK